MRFGIYVPSYGAYGDPAILRDLAIAAEASGWSGFFMYDVLGWDPQVSPVADPWVTLGIVAQATSTIRIGPMVVPVPRRRPWKLALEASTLQRFSGGRLILGVGAGAHWDYTRFGETRAEMGSRVDEGTGLLHQLLSGQQIEFTGRHYRLDGAQLPAADVPIWASGFWPRKVPFRGAENAAGLFPQVPEDGFRFPTPGEVTEIREAFIGAGGRADADLAIWSETRRIDPDRVAAYESAGATWWFESAADDSPQELERRISQGPPLKPPGLAG